MKKRPRTSAPSALPGVLLGVTVMSPSASVQAVGMVPVTLTFVPRLSAQLCSFPRSQAGLFEKRSFMLATRAAAARHRSARLCLPSLSKHLAIAE